VIHGPPDAGARGVPEPTAGQAPPLLVVYLILLAVRPPQRFSVTVVPELVKMPDGAATGGVLESVATEPGSQQGALI
jgi:hypothetical protein